MSLATRCTHCGTIFKVVQDQLKASDGWVRCGRCNEVFNAMPALFDLDTESPPPRVSAPTEPQPSPPEPEAGPDSQPSGWVHTEADSPIDPIPQPTQAVVAATEFDLDTAVDVDGPDDTGEPPTSMNLDLQASPSPWLSEAPEADPELPATDEADALDSRYLLPSTRERKAARRRDRGPEFADAQFPSDAMQDAEDDWASDFGNLPIEPEFAPTPAAAPAPVVAPPANALRTGTLGSPAAASGPVLIAALSRAATPAPTDDDDDSVPTTQPSRFGENYVPELPVEPPSLRKGRPGTRGRDPAQQTPEFVKRAQRQAVWRHPAVRGVLSVLLIGLSLGLALQIAHQFRDVLAAYYPEARPILSQWCAVADCQIQPPLKLDSLQVESATLVRANSEGPDHYRLAVVVHNRAAIGLAWPHIDLTLTDDNGAVIGRRVFDPRDAQWLDTAEPKADAPTASARPSASAPLPAAAPSQRSTTLQWRLRATDLRPAGYTAELFYP